MSKFRTIVVLGIVYSFKTYGTDLNVDYLVRYSVDMKIAKMQSSIIYKVLINHLQYMAQQSGKSPLIFTNTITMHKSYSTSNTCTKFCFQKFTFFSHA